MWADASPRAAARRADPIAALHDRIEILEEENRQLRRLLIPSLPLPSQWRLSRTQALLVRAIRGAAPGILAPERAEVAVYGFEEAPDSNSWRSLLCRARTKLLALDEPIQIRTVWGQGYLMPPESVAVFDRLTAQAAS